ncbi:MAG: DNA mismatch repair protein MutT, partial [Oscillospiraceae bacterium]
IEGFRERVDYSPRPNVEKQVIYFLAGTDDSPVKIQEEEISGFCWMEPKKAYASVMFENDRRLIKKAIDFLNERF